MTRFPVFGTYYICLSHHVLTWNYSSCVSCISHLWWDTFKLVVWYWFASWIWFLACIASSLMNATYDETILTWQSDIDCTFHMVSCSVSNLLKCLLLSYHIIGVNMSSRPFFRTYAPFMLLQRTTIIAFLTLFLPLFWFCLVKSNPQERGITVSYTHLTLPTNREV